MIRTRSILKKVVLLFAVFLFCLGHAIAKDLVEACKTSADDKFVGMLYEIKNPKGQKSFLFGTLHEGNKKLQKLPDVVFSSLKRSKIVYLESLETVDDIEKFTQITSSLPQGTTLKQVLKEQTYLRLQKVLNALRIDERKKKILEERTVMTAFSFLDSNPEDYDESLSIDTLLHKAAAERDLEVKGLENISSKLLAWNSITQAEWQDYAEELLDIYDCESCRISRDRFKTCIAEKVLKGESDGLREMYDRFYAHYTAQKIVSDKLIFSRNMTLVNNIVSAMKDQGSSFFSMGALHLGGSSGVINKLRRLGFKVVKLG